MVVKLKSKQDFQIRQPISPAEYDEYYDLRWRVLRKPWKMPVGSEREERDATASHYIAVNEDQKIVGAGRLHLKSEKEAQIRFMAVEDAFQKKGVGKALIIAMEAEAVQRGAETAMLMARDYAVGFYERLGYKIEEKTFILFGNIQHYKMRKQLLTE